MKKLNNRKYYYLTNVFAALSMGWIGIGCYVYYAYIDSLRTSLIPDGGDTFYFFLEGMILILTFLGVVFGLLNLKKEKKWSVGLLLNAIVFTTLFVILLGENL